MLSRFYCQSLRLQLPQLQHLQHFASFTLRDVVRDYSDETGTLLTRFAKHIAIERYNGNKVLAPTKIRYSDYFPITDERYFQRELHKIQADQLPALIIHAFTYRANAQPAKYILLLNELDAIAVKQLNNMSMDTILETLYAFLYLVPNWIMRLDFYQLALKRLVAQDFANSGASKEVFVQICFYLGLHKKHANTASLLNNFLAQNLKNYLQNLSSMDLAIVCNAAYKTATIVYEQQSVYEQRLIDEVLQLQLQNDSDALLITFIKALRLQRVHSEAICLKLAEFCKQTEQLQQLQLRGLAHLFVYLVEQQWDHIECIKTITEQFFKHISDNDVHYSLRAKDLATFLWCFAQFNVQISKKQLQELEQLVIQKLHDNEYNNFVDNLVDTCLSLWTLEQRSLELLTAAWNLKSKQMQHSKKIQPKVDSRLQVLLAAAEIEEPTWHKNLKIKKNTKAFVATAETAEYLLKDRADLIELTKKLHAKEEGVLAAQLVCPISGINVPSLLLTRQPGDVNIFVELLNAKQILKFSGKPVALIRLKIRLLEALHQQVAVLRSTEVQENYAKFIAQLIDYTATQSPKIADSGQTAHIV